MTNSNTSNVNSATFGRVPTTSLEWLANNTSCPIAKLWAVSWFADPFGSRFVKLPSLQVGESSLKKARKVIKDAGLFSYEPKKDDQDSRKTKYWQVKNLLGCKVNNTTKETEIESPITTSIEKIEVASEDLEGIYRDLEAPITTSILPETLTGQASCNPSRSFQDTKQDKEKEIKNKQKENEPTLNATAQLNEIENKQEHISEKSVCLGDLLRLIKTQYMDRLPTVKDGFIRKPVSIEQNGFIKIHIVDLLPNEVPIVRDLLSCSVNEISAFLDDYSDSCVAVFSFAGHDLEQFDLCG